LSSRYRHIPGGLDNAVRQAEERGLREMNIVDADCHLIPSPQDLAKYFDRVDFHYDLPSDMEVDPAVALEFGDTAAALEALERSNHPSPGRILENADRPFGRPHKSIDEAVDRFTTRMEDIGIKYSLIYPERQLSSLTYPRRLASPEFEAAVSNAYMDYMLDNLLGDHREINTFIPIPASAPDKAVDLIDRVASEKGVVGAAISPVQAKGFGDSRYFEIYEALQRKGLPINVHGTVQQNNNYTGQIFDGLENQRSRRLAYWALNFYFWTQKQIVSLVTAGVPERFPELEWVWVESGLTWIPALMTRLDQIYNSWPDHHPYKLGDNPILKKMPSEYMRDFYYTTQPLETPFGGKKALEWVFDSFDAENHLLFSSDLPHNNMDVPSVVFDLPFLSKTARDNIMGENALKLYDKIR